MIADYFFHLLKKRISVSMNDSKIIKFGYFEEDIEKNEWFVVRIPSEQVKKLLLINPDSKASHKALHMKQH